MQTLTEKLLTLLPKKEHLFVSVMGSGGKTSLLKLLGAFYGGIGKSVLLTTTTKFQNPVFFDWNADTVITDREEALSYVPEKGSVTLYAEPYSDMKKLQSPPLYVLERLKNRFDVTFSEADGSRGLPLKIHTERDPVLPVFNDFTVSLLGADACNERVADVVFGYELTALGEKKYVDKEYLEYVISSKDGALKGAFRNFRVLLLNRYECLKETNKNLYRTLEYPSNLRVLGVSVQQNCVYDVLN